MIDLKICDNIQQIDNNITILLNIAEISDENRNKYDNLMRLYISMFFLYISLLKKYMNYDKIHLYSCIVFQRNQSYCYA